MKHYLNYGRKHGERRWHFGKAVDRQRIRRAELIEGDLRTGEDSKMALTPEEKTTDKA